MKIIMRLMLKVFIINFLLLIHIPLLSQNKTDVMLFGHVTNAKTGEHIPFATIKVKGTKYGTMTDKSGHYKLANIPVGNLTLIAQVVGYKQLEKDVTTELNKGIQIYFELEEDVLNMESIVVTATKSKH